ncbi:Asp-tRNA(Asn)/Glu-tRNA(Gln) amidotransferase GatCAB subunit C [Ahniella affigens]|uniref:Aspartyl/glutamyl-tRNA(Asn/Gln) amidotransferase subunit C n=1 Tax=Ahniella affigens TaxID=2021234 RepID=A0A2P1PTG4_9GAMM|nr:Asp-tRNA(Asn)/Glu-tRNA(Gln) amidotransferase subunit GatC [Ahniella affigens]AVP98133.1 Asp-tRNA(Asn)/Glu-tRNA(Gln) amidotransferase GatCAB subunit C [Ahniella affigens]
MEQATIHKLATLARLALSPELEQRLAADLSELLGLVSELQRVDVNGVLPMAHPHDAIAPLRPDVPEVIDHSPALERLAPDMSQGLYRVPKVIE